MLFADRWSRPLHEVLAMPWSSLAFQFLYLQIKADDEQTNDDETAELYTDDEAAAIAAGIEQAKHYG